MEFEVLGWPPDGPQLRLDHRQFSYAGKFVMTSTGKAVARDPGASTAASDDADWTDVDPPPGTVGAVAFNADRTDPDRLWLRYVTVRADRRGEGIGPRLVDHVVESAGKRGYKRVAIAVNNVFAYHALYSAGFRYSGRRTGLAELVLTRSVESVAPPDPERYRAGLALFAGRDRTDAERRFVAARAASGPPDCDP